MFEIIIWFMKQSMGIVFGMIIEASLNNPIKKLIGRVRKSAFKLYYSNKRKNALQNYRMILGNTTTTIRVIDGDGNSTFRDQNIKIHIEESVPFSWPQEVEDLYCQVKAELENRKKNGAKVPWNGDVLSLYKYNIQRTPNYEDNAISLYLGKTQYYYPYAIICNLNDTLRSKYMQDIDSNVEYRLPNAFGISFLARTRDNKAIFAIRSSESGYRPGESDVTIVEGLNPQLDMNGHTIIVSDVVKRAFTEEICSLGDCGFQVLSLGILLDEKFNQWNFVGYIEVDMKQDEIIKRRNLGTSGKWELRSLDFIEFDPRSVFFYFSTHKIWDMGIATACFALINQGYSYEELEKMANKYLK